MTVKSEGTWSGLIVTLDATGAKATPSVGPAGVLYINGTADAAEVTISGSNPYSWAVTLPSLSAGDRVSMYITATIATIATAAVVAEESADTIILSDGVTLGATQGAITWGQQKIVAADTTEGALDVVNSTGPAVRIETSGNGKYGLDIAGGVDGEIENAAVILRGETNVVLDSSLTSIASNINTIGSYVDDIGVEGAGLTAIPWNAAWDAEVESEVTDGLNAYDPPTNAEMEARTLLAANYFDPATDTVAAVTTVGSVTGAVGSVTGAVGSVTGNVGGSVTGSVGSVASGGITAASLASDAITAAKVAADVSVEIATQVNTTLSASHGSGAWGGASGSGAITWEYTLTSSVDATPIADADVSVYSDLAMTALLASGITDQYGKVTFYLDAGTVYLKRVKTGWNFTNPDTEVVA